MVLEAASVGFADSRRAGRLQRDCVHQRISQPRGARSRSAGGEGIWESAGGDGESGAGEYTLSTRVSGVVRAGGRPGWLGPCTVLRRLLPAAPGSAGRFWAGDDLDPHSAVGLGTGSRPDRLRPPERSGTCDGHASGRRDAADGSRTGAAAAALAGICHSRRHRRRLVLVERTPPSRIRSPWVSSRLVSGSATRILDWSACVNRRVEVTPCSAPLPGCGRGVPTVSDGFQVGGFQ